MRSLLCQCSIPTPFFYNCSFRYIVLILKGIQKTNQSSMLSTCCWGINGVESKQTRTATAMVCSTWENYLLYLQKTLIWCKLLWIILQVFISSGTAQRNESTLPSITFHSFSHLVYPLKNLRHNAIILHNLNLFSQLLLKNTPQCRGW